MKRYLSVLALGAALDILGGCASQVIKQLEYYEPTDKTSYKREDGLTVGALKSEVIKSGSPDWSGSKTLSLISVGK